MKELNKQHFIKSLLSCTKNLEFLLEHGSLLVYMRLVYILLSEANPYLFGMTDGVHSWKYSVILSKFNHFNAHVSHVVSNLDVTWITTQTGTWYPLSNNRTTTIKKINFKVNQQLTQTTQDESFIDDNFHN